MTAPQTEATTDPQSIITALQQRLDAALAREATLAEELAARTAELAQRNTDYSERIEHQTATVDVLKAMSASPGDTQPIFDLITRRARELCNGANVGLWEFGGELVHASSVSSLFDPSPVMSRYPMRPNRATIAGRSILEGKIIHIRDADSDPELLDEIRSTTKSILGLPLLREGTVIGSITLNALESGGFSDSQIALLQTFAEQAVIAITSAETYRGLHEALEQQTATAEVLQVINAKPGDLAPVFDAMLERALRLGEAAFGTIRTFDGKLFHLAASRGASPALLDFQRKPLQPGPRAARMLRGEDVIHTPNVIEGEAYKSGAPAQKALAELAGARSHLSVALRSEHGLLGYMSFYRQEVRPFTDKQVALLQDFAAQAVVAMENARLITEQREALEQQTATAEVLQVINASPGNLAPVFDAILEKAHRLCGATHGSLQLFDGEKFRAVATYGISEVWAERTRDGLPAVNNPVTEPLLAGARLVHIADMVDINHPLARVAAEATGVRTALFVPLRKDNSLIGVISALRREVRPFTEKEIALLENFAAQAVIAIENARLIIEQQDALEQQTATAEVLQVINASPGNLVPVFDAMLDRALRLCSGAYGSLLTFDGEKFLSVATRGDTQFSDWARQRGPFEPPSEGPLHRSLKGEDIVEITDLLEHSEIHEDPVIHRMVELGGYRSLLNVALRKENVFFGVIAIYRKEKRPFDHKEIALLQNFAAQAVIAIENARLITEQREALEQQTATAEVLQVINSSPGNLAPVFDAMLEKAMRLCGAAIGGIYRYNGQGFDTVALLGVTPAFQEYNDKYPMVEVRPGSLPARMIETRGPVQNPDVLASERAWSPYARALAELGGIRAVLDVPLLKEGALLGFIAIYREEAGAFSDKQIALLEDFAAQAVIAMENARLITETQEALQQQTATAEVLQVINSSPGDLGPVFDAMLDRAMALCEADYGHVYAFEGGQFTPAAIKGDPGFISYRTQRGPIRPQGDGTSALERLIAGESVVWAADVHEEQAYRTNARFRELADTAGIRSMATIALRKENSLRGAIIVYRRQVRPFSQKQIALLQNFAAQAVIAMENARLINEQREALEQQTATAEVLQVINGNPGDLAPVFDAMLEKATRLCDAAAGTFWVSDGEQWQAVAIRGMPEHFVTSAREYRPSPNSPVGRLAGGEELVHLPDLSAEEVYKYGDRLVRAAVDTNGIRTLLSVPLRNERRILGVFSLYRREVHPFTDTQIALAQNFAAQAVIAMENARLLTEQREALEQQTATAEVLQVINASPGNLVPVFDAILEKAHNLCDVAVGSLSIYLNGFVHTAATRGFSEEYQALLRHPYPAIGSHQTLMRGGPSRQTSDFRTVPVCPEMASSLDHFERMNLRTGLWVPLRKDGTALGCISAYRDKVQPFSEKEIALLENFAAQAVIAMENARLMTEQREALEQQTATAEVLQVINASPGNLAPVFDAMLEKAMHLCGAAFGELYTLDGDDFRPVALMGIPAALAAYRRSAPPPAPAGSIVQRIREGANIVHTADAKDADLYRSGEPTRRALVDLGGARSVLTVALRKDEALLGFISIYRQEVRLFTDRQIALLENFAAQAVIAMENARLITEQREALEQQTATAEVLQVINASPGDLTPVFEAILEKAHRICNFDMGSLATYDGTFFRAVATRGYSDQAEVMARTPYRPLTIQRALLRGDRLIHILDTQTYPVDPDDATTPAFVTASGFRACLTVPLRKDGTLLGFLTGYRKVAGPFSEKQIVLLENFAAQAVIAMENARLINEQREALEQQTATAEVLQVINASPGDLAPVFDAMLEKAMRLCEAQLGVLATYDGERFRRAAARGMPGAEAQGWPEWIVPDPGSALERVVNGDRVVHIVDLVDTDAYRQGVASRLFLVERTGARTALWVALRKDDALLGVFVIYRREVRAFSEKQIALVENFAAQAVIAMENARLLDEIRQRQEELRVTFENMGDGVAMFDETQHLVAWNRKFQEIFEVPDALLEEHQTYAEYIRYLGERGDYGPNMDVEEQIRHFTETAREYHAYERVRPDGRVVEIRRNPVAGGGFVLIFSDITERKRSEAEIRAARDAAEEASRTIEAAYRDLKAAQANLIQAEKMASLGQLTAGIAHEIKNPLNFVNNFATLSVDLLGELKEAAAPGFAALTEKQRAEVEEVSVMLTSNLEKITEHGKRADGIVKAMLEHSRGSSGERRTVDLNALIDEALNLAYHGARAQDQSFNITLERDFGEGISPIELNPQDITRVFLNLFSNGFYATTRRACEVGDAGFVPTLKVTTVDASEAVEIRVRDNGIGIPGDIRDKLFQPFFTTKPTGEGTGLGLSITYDIVTQQHGGSIAVDSKVGDYSEFTVRLPRGILTSERGRA